jgi:predicted heme/steroid binding protein
MAEFTGAGLYVAFNGAVISTDFREWKDSREMGLVDASAGADVHETSLKTLKSGGASLKYLIQKGAANAIRVALKEGSESSLIWGPEGNTAGNQKFSVNAIVKKHEMTIPYKDVVEGAADWTFSDAAGVVEGTF